MNTHVKLGVIRKRHEGRPNIRDDLLHIPDIHSYLKKSRVPVHAMLLNVEAAPNIGVMVRTACAFNIEKVWIVGRRRYDKRPTVGSDHYIDIERIHAMKSDKEVDERAVIEILKRENLIPVVAELGGEYLGRTNIWKLVSNSKPCIIMGNEWDGISENVMSTIRDNFPNFIKVTIPQKGAVRSLNVSVAFSIILYDFLLNTGNL